MYLFFQHCDSKITQGYLATIHSKALHVQYPVRKRPTDSITPIEYEAEERSISMDRIANTKRSSPDEYLNGRN
jgi:hypothetical protein